MNRDKISQIGAHNNVRVKEIIQHCDTMLLCWRYISVGNKNYNINNMVQIYYLSNCIFLYFPNRTI